jgi:hypothetical protein
VSAMYTCTECGTEVPFDDIAYLGNEADDQCSPFMELTCLCKECYLNGDTDDEEG